MLGDNLLGDGQGCLHDERRQVEALISGGRRKNALLLTRAAELDAIVSGRGTSRHDKAPLGLVTWHQSHPQNPSL
jgi:hypothetical protein